MKNRFPRRAWVMLAVVLGVFVFAYLTQMIMHRVPEISLIETNPIILSSTCTTRFCDVQCPAGYYALAGNCSSLAGWQYNLVGVSTTFASWECFDSSLINKAKSVPVPTQTAEVSCVKFGGPSLPIIGSPNNYRKDPGEVCDLNNTGDLDCTDFSVFDEGTGGLVPLCNGWLTCTANGQGYDISHCEYCENGFANGVPVGNNGACSLPSTCVCDPSDPSGCLGGNPAICGNAIVELGEQCDPDNGVTCVGCRFTTPPLCGNGIVEPTEECDPDGQVSPDGMTAVCIYPEVWVPGETVCELCMWHNHPGHCSGDPIIDPHNSGGIDPGPVNP